MSTPVYLSLLLPVLTPHLSTSGTLSSILYAIPWQTLMPPPTSFSLIYFVYLISQLLDLPPMSHPLSPTPSNSFCKHSNLHLIFPIVTHRCPKPLLLLCVVGPCAHLPPPPYSPASPLAHLPLPQPSPGVGSVRPSGWRVTPPGVPVAKGM